MGQNSKIEWTHHTFNPWWGCVEVSPACDHCYARTFSKRTGNDLWGKDAPRRFFGDKHWADPVKWNAAAEKLGERHRVFCGSMCDVMEDGKHLNPTRVRLYNLIDDTPNLDWLLLTKRPQNFKRFLPQTWMSRPRKNVWLMTTVESREYYWRIDALDSTPAAVRGLSIEPLLGPMDDLIDHLYNIDWVIVGGESGPGARPMHPDWARSVRDQTRATGSKFFLKQWGEYSPLTSTDGVQCTPFGDFDVKTNFGFAKLGKKKSGRLLDGRTWDELPEVRR